MNLEAILLRENWRLFVDINRHAGQQPIMDGLMVISANDLILVFPLLLLLWWFAFVRWSPLVRGGAHTGAHMDMQATEAGRTTARTQVRRLGQQMALVASGAAVVALAGNILVGNLLFEPRPFVSHPQTVHLLVQHVADASFPSDHEAVSSAIAWSLLLAAFLLIAGWLRQRPHASRAGNGLGGRLFLVAAILAVLAVLTALVIGFARIYVGEHYPGDIVGGAGCGLLAALLLTVLRRWISPLLNGIIAFAERLHLA